MRGVIAFGVLAVVAAVADWWFAVGVVYGCAFDDAVEFTAAEP
jgi:hypothetical protein